MKEKQNKKLRSKISIKWNILLIVLGCWVLPIIIISTATGYFMTKNVNEQVVQTVLDSVYTNISISSTRLEAAIFDSRFATYDSTVFDAWTRFSEDKDGVAFYDSIKSFLEKQYKYNEKFCDSILFFKDEPEQFHYTFNNQNDATYADIRYYKENVHEEIKRFAETLDTSIGFYSKGDRLYMVRNLVDNRYKPYAVLVLDVFKNSVFDSISTVPWATDITLCLNDTNVTLKGKWQDLDSLIGNETYIDPPLYIDKNGSMHIYGMRRLESFKLKYSVTADTKPLLNELMGFTDIIRWMVLLIVPLLVVAMRFFYRNVSRPVDLISRHAHCIESGQFGIQIKENFHSCEFQYMADSFNEMSARLKYQFDKIYREELALRDARIMALQSQINPHFLNNTLEIINWEARIAENTKVSEMIEALSTMLNAAMDRKGNPEVHLSEEMMYVDAYLYIISQRLGKRLTVKKEIDAALLDLYVPRLIMQPIIENAVEHGVTPLQRGEIILRAYSLQNGFVLEVENNGLMTKEDEERVALLLSDGYDASAEGAANLGIRNVHQRLRIIYGEKSGLTIKTNEQGRVVSKIVICND